MNQAEFLQEVYPLIERLVKGGAATELKPLMDEMEKHFIASAMMESDKDWQIAAHLGLKRTTLIMKKAKHKLRE